MATLNTNTSIVDLLKSKNLDSSPAGRASLAASYGMTGYSGSSADNMKLMSFVQGGGDQSKGLNAIINSDQQTVKDAAAAAVDTPPTRTPPLVVPTVPTTSVAEIVPDKTAPTAPKLETEYMNLRTKYNVTDLENQLNELTAEENLLTATKRQRVQAQIDKPVEMGVIAGRVSEVERQENERIDAVLRKKSFVADQVKTAYTVIDSILKMKSTDYDTAKQEYDDAFQKAVTVIGLNKDNSNEAQTTARANLQVVYNALTSGGADYDALDETMKTTIAKLEVQSGLPQGFIQTLKSKNPKADIISSSTRQDSSGAKYTDIVMRGEDGKMVVQSIYLGKERLPVGDGGGGKMTESEIERQARSKVSTFLSGRTGGDGYVAPDDYKAARNAWIKDGFSRVEFDEEYKSYANPKSRSSLGITL